MLITYIHICGSGGGEVGIGGSEVRASGIPPSAAVLTPRYMINSPLERGAQRAGCVTSYQLRINLRLAYACLRLPRRFTPRNDDELKLFTHTSLLL